MFEPMNNDDREEETTMDQRHDHHDNEIHPGDIVRFVRDPNVVKTVAGARLYRSIEFTDGSWTQARHVELVDRGRKVDR